MKKIHVQDIVNRSELMVSEKKTSNMKKYIQSQNSGQGIEI